MKSMRSSIVIKTKLSLALCMVLSAACYASDFNFAAGESANPLEESFVENNKTAKTEPTIHQMSEVYNYIFSSGTLDSKLKSQQPTLSELKQVYALARELGRIDPAAEVPFADSVPVLNARPKRPNVCAVSLGLCGAVFSNPGMSLSKAKIKVCFVELLALKIRV